VSAERQSDPWAQLNRYLAAFAKRDAAAVAASFAHPAILELPAVKPSRFLGREEVGAAHAAVFENLEEAVIETDEILSAEDGAMASGRMTVVCRGQKRVQPFAIVADSTASGLSRVSWYWDSRGQRLWSDKTVL
jgi:ketosteroid isomerase-like protein